MNNTLVAGGAGFIGSHLCKVLLEKSSKVICVDNLITGSRKNIEDLFNNPSFKFIKFDITCNFQKIVSKLGKINRIYHLASPASPIQYQRYPVETLMANSLGTYFLLKLAYATSAKFLYASTSEVYGNPKEHPQKETYFGNVNSFGPRACYDEAKRFGEALVYTFIDKYRVDARIVRIFNTYGPNMEENDGRVISNFINQALKGKDITIYGDGRQTRSFCYVSDMVEGLVASLEKEITNGEVINLGNDDERSILEIADLILKLTAANSKIAFKDLPEDDPEKRKPDIKKARQLLLWSPKITLAEGLKKTIDYFKNL